MKKTQSNSLPYSASERPTTFPTVPVEEVPIPSWRPELGGRHPSVLVVDDESAIADTLTEILKRSGYAARSAYDAESALESALLTPPELLISDVILPGMNGIELAITMKRIFPDCKVILFSGQASSFDLGSSAARREHNFPLLLKPVRPADLLARVTESFSSRHQRTAVNIG